MNAQTSKSAVHLKLERFWLIVGLGFIAIVVFLSLTTDPPDTGLPQGMKIGHVLAYCWLMSWFAQIYRTASTRYRLALTFCALGIALEYVQGLTDYRGFEYSDMLINAVGVGLGLLLSYTPFQNGLARVEMLLLRRRV
jgi:VanZ family protein